MTPNERQAVFIAAAKQMELARNGSPGDKIAARLRAKAILDSLNRGPAAPPIFSQPDQSTPSVVNGRGGGIFWGVDPVATKGYYAELRRRGPIGEVCVRLFRASKANHFAKHYKGKSIGLAYERKSVALNELSVILQEQGVALQIRFGWANDPKQAWHNQVLYVDLPTGQVSYHNRHRYQGPDYPGTWDGLTGVGDERVIAFCDQVIERPPLDPS